MQNKTGIVILTTIVTLLCLYYLSFTFVSRRVQSDATEYATDKNGNIDFQKKASYLDSVRKEPVYNLLGIKYTYEEVNANELHLGLDLQGGMHVTLQVSPVEIISGLSGNSTDPNFIAALKKANQLEKTSQKEYVSLFYDAYREIEPNVKLSRIFANTTTKGRISYDNSNEEVLKVLRTEVNDAIFRTFNILRTRIDKFGVTQPNIQIITGTSKIQIELPGADNPERIRKLLQGVAKLEFWEVWEINEISASLQAVNSYLLEKQKLDKSLLTENSKATDSKETAQATTPADTSSLAQQLAGKPGDTTSTATDSLNSQASPLFSLLRSPYGLVYESKDTAKINRIFKNPDVKKLLPSTLKFAWGVKPLSAGVKDKSVELFELYVLKATRNGKAPLDGSVINNARQDIDQNGRGYEISMTMNAKGAKEWKRLTAENTQRRIAVVLDNLVYTAPTVQSEIPNGVSSITGNFTLDEAKDLANILKAGKLPAKPIIVEEAIVGPSLGKEAISQGLLSTVVGMILVVLFMVVYYSKGGWIANLALLINVFFILGILAQMEAALTLPGIAGIVLTIGMSVDANVLIFERMREELKAGKPIATAVKLGFDKAYSSIIDSNVTTFLIGIILNFSGSGPVQGFAITLMIGILCSLFTAVFITRVVFEYMLARNRKISLDTVFSRNLFKLSNYDIIGKRKIAYIFSGTIIVIGFVLMYFQGISLGVDFKGGRTYVVRFDKPIVASEVRAAIFDDFKEAGTEVKTYDQNNQVKITTTYLIDETSTEADDAVKKALVAGLSSFNGYKFQPDDTKPLRDEFTIVNSSKVGATVADDITSSSVKGMILSLIAIFIYVVIRFRRWQYGLGALIALFHDVLVAFALTAILKAFGIVLEVDQVYIAAILTVIGYSINDTVVIFDRIREFLTNNPKADMAHTINESINHTFSRTIITAMTVFIVVMVLLIFGGEVLRGFSFVMLVGVTIGSYSSIFIASPIVLDFASRAQKKVAAKVA